MSGYSRNLQAGPVPCCRALHRIESREPLKVGSFFFLPMRPSAFKHAEASVSSEDPPFHLGFSKLHSFSVRLALPLGVPAGT